MSLLCPVCAAPLAFEGRSLRCANRHTFDLAREGYVNLMMEQKAGRVLGDSKEMLRARRAFLEAGFYTPLSEAVNRMVEAHLPAGEAQVVLDAGCGEGYYLGRLKHHLDLLGNQANSRWFGMDIAKEAVRMAAKKYPDLFFFVADTWKPLLFADRSVHLLLNIFAPRNAPEFARVTAPQGLLLLVIPRPEHLGELRGEVALLEIEENKEQRVLGQLAEQFRLIERQELQQPMSLSQEALLNLIEMSPSSRHLQQPVTDVAVHQVTAAVTLLLLQRAGE